ncbi:MAG: SIS domain-containing protein [Phycisphaerales bacterium]|nr:SIS domain-containing protein [Phycisphaerales bacterium]
MHADTQNHVELLTTRLEGSLKSIESLRPMLPDVLRIGNALLERLESSGVLYTAGNGGSAAQALHMAEELIGRYRGDRSPLPAICLNADSTALTCIANDYGYDSVFARQCHALLKPDDVLLVMTTSGRSDNLIEALQAARDAGAMTIGLLGGTGGPCQDLCDHPILVNSDDSAFIQDAHQVLIHLLCELAEHRTQH